MNLILLFLVLGLFTLAERYSFLVFLSNWKMPRIMLKALRYAPVTVMFALVMPIILRTEGAIEISFNPKIIAATIGIFVAWRTRNVLFTLGSGMLIFWLSSWLLSLLAT